MKSLLLSPVITTPTGRHQLFDAIAAGYEMVSWQVRYIAGIEQVITAARWYWADDEPFVDDANFTDTLFAWSLEVHREADQEEMLPGAGTVYHAACDQLHRMLLTGRIDTRYSVNLAIMLDTRNTSVCPTLAACDFDTADIVNDICAEMLEDMRGWASYRHLPRLQAQIEPERAMLFERVWLPAAITPTEYARIAGQPITLLRELYAQVWQGGYPLYHERIKKMANS